MQDKEDDKQNISQLFGTFQAIFDRGVRLSSSDCLIILDNISTHWSKFMKEYVKSQDLELRFYKYIVMVSPNREVFIDVE